MAIHKADINKVLVINLAYIGDMIIGFPVLRALRNEFSQATIDMLVTPGVAVVAGANPFIQEVIQYDKTGVHKNIFALWTLIKNLRSRQYDMVICTNLAVRGAILAWLLGSKYRVGYDLHGGRFFLTHAASNRYRHLHEARRRLEQLEVIGIHTDDIRLAYTLDADFAGAVERFLAQWGLKEKTYTVICPAGRHARKSWSNENMALLIDWLYACYGQRTILIGGSKDEASIREIAERCASHPVQAAGVFNLRQLPHLITKARCMISVDTGPMHMAAALDIPVVALFGPTKAALWRPLSENSIVVQAPGKNMINLKLEDVQNACQECLRW
ncbi:putative lipopolysaccharide heptosyltransferase III [Acetonema longum]|uniref:Lipopolysaccharide heptosyltransferase II n=1 Tax=Acetonema longum DSM 6540 TaxID=1009370 RepID=F7NLY5_9FIRM|nr:putative lipopolysaccharide heptosyltransferase III [Acetonema longum]EGO62911.1 lipopolysaccharide heptosyltransferase II [Acetonema longum DSM 6540]